MLPPGPPKHPSASPRAPSILQLPPGPISILQLPHSILLLPPGHRQHPSASPRAPPRILQLPPGPPQASFSFPQGPPSILQLLCFCAFIRLHSVRVTSVRTDPRHIEEDTTKDWDRDQFAKLVREVAAPDVGRMGIEILSFTIKVEYLSSLGKAQTAAVRRDADIGVAEAERDAGIREALCKREMLDVKYLADTKMADSKREFEMQKAGFSQEVNTKKAEAQLAYELQAAKEQQKIRQEEIEIKVVQRKKQIDIEEKEIVRMDKELIATVRRPAEAEAYRMQQIAEGEKVKQVLYAQAEAEKIRKIGDAEAATIKAIGKAEAEKMKLKAGAYQQYGEAAKMAMVLECLPQIAAKVSAPLAKVDEIGILSGDNSKITGEMNRLLAEVPASVQALTGVDLTKIPLIQKATGILA
uniref:Flotillin n=1 Tax=Xenopus tropicalis TaxID=8364 RepID=F7EPY6_XENTR